MHRLDDREFAKFLLNKIYIYSAATWIDSRQRELLQEVADTGIIHPEIKEGFLAMREIAKKKGEPFKNAPA